MIYCVEDEDSIRDIEEYALRSAGFETRGFADGTAFWDALQTERPQLLGRHAARYRWNHAPEADPCDTFSAAAACDLGNGTRCGI